MTRFLIVLTLFVGITSCSRKDSGMPAGSNYSHDKNPGTSANDLLSASRFESVKIEIHYMPGYQPEASTLTHLTNFLTAVLNKPGGIQLVQKEIPASANSVLSITEVVNIERQHRTVYTTGKQLGVFILFTNGGYSSPNTLGVAYYNTSICVFGKNIHDNSGGLGQVGGTKLEATALEHEFGHLLGLVDIGSLMQVNHHDAAHTGHCNNSNCLMYYSAETTDILGMLSVNPVPELDNNCRNDLGANGGK